LRLHAPEDYYKIAILLRDNERFGIQRIWSRAHNVPVAAVSAQRLHAIAGKYVGKEMIQLHSYQHRANFLLLKKLFLHA
jgi:fructose 1,6-bisphosphate aldolase/phosphatase